MRLRLKIRLGFALIAIVALIVISPLRFVFTGLVKRQSFYRNLPTDYWDQKVGSYFKGIDSYRSRTWYHDVFDRMTLHDPVKLPTVLSGDSAAVPVLIELLGSESSEVRCTAAVVLARTGDAGRTAVPALIKALDSLDGDLRALALYVLRHLAIEHADSEAEAAVFAALRTRNRDWAMGFLPAFGPKAKSTVPDLCDVLRDLQAADSHGSAISALGAIGPDASEAIPVLVELFERESEEVSRDEAFRMANRINIPCAVLGEATLPSRGTIAVVIQESRLLGVPAERRPYHLPIRSEFQCDWAVCALVHLGSEPKILIPVMKQWIRQKRVQCYGWAGGWNLERLNVNAGFPDSHLKTPLGNLDLGYSLPMKGDKVLDTLVKGLTNPDPTVRRLAAESIQILGPSASPAVSDLLRALKDSDCSVRKAVWAALRSVGFPPVWH